MGARGFRSRRLLSTICVKYRKNEKRSGTSAQASVGLGGKVVNMAADYGLSNWLCHAEQFLE